MLQSQCHFIGTMRSKTAWEVQKDERTGKTKPVKVGLAPVQRDGLEYEFTSVLELSIDGHIATASKDRTSLFDNQFFVPGIETGEALRDWLQGSKGNGGQKNPAESEAPQELPAAKPTGKVTQLRDVSRADILSLVCGQLREIGLADKIAEYKRYVRHKYGAGMKDLPADKLEEQAVNWSAARMITTCVRNSANTCTGCRRRKEEMPGPEGLGLLLYFIEFENGLSHTY